MKWTVLVVGRDMPPPIRVLVNDYLKRLGRFLPVELIEITEEKRRSQAQQGKPGETLLREHERLVKHIPSGALVVLLESAGQVLTSLEFAKTIDHWRQQGPGHICFVIGGPDGLHPALHALSSVSLSLGAMTWPHMLARVLLLEQLYRGLTLIHGFPYHR
ncbi:MAG: 23S rRNA (pseudouridine(1915)-N(3))-methyltransferase RlmH [Magnetococcus sp. DMHC-6]